MMYQIHSSLIFLFALLTGLYAFENMVPSCSTCKFFIPNDKHPDLGLCEMFQDNIFCDGRRRRVKNFAVHCRNMESMCGKSGYLYEPKIGAEEADANKGANGSDNKIQQYRISNLFFDETQEQLEREMLYILQKMRKHNTQRLYSTAKGIYNILKK